ncbi:MAG: SDR family NAD(P)-dependent oxidoreductase, partial [Alcaligenaceae bacterium]|nr:SDR family NAD(P)-dependent oxidoreductase [Alcaligenaceae bacterium]
MFELTDQIAIVTGGAKGIGKGIVKTLIQGGAKVVIADIDEAAGKQTA